MFLFIVMLMQQQTPTHALVWTSGKVRMLRFRERGVVDVSVEEASSSLTSTSAVVAARRLVAPPKLELVADQIDERSVEDKDKRDVEWLVQATSELLGPESPSLGSMSKGSIHRAILLMKAWSRRNEQTGSNSPHVVERLLKRLLDERDAGNENVVINTKVYNILLDAWSKSHESGSAERAEEILEGMERMYNMGNQQMRPNEASYNAVIKAYVKNGNRLYAANKAEALLDRMVKSPPYNGANSNDAAGFHDKFVSPNRRGYNLLLYALANSSLEDAPKRAENILRKMKDGYTAGNAFVKPDINSYNQAIGSWARGRQKGFEVRMERLFEELVALPAEMEIQPNTDTFNALMGGWLKSNKDQALSKIEEILHMMEQYHLSGNDSAKPDRVSVNTVIAAYAKNSQNGAVDKALALKTKMEKRYNITADTMSNNIVVDSWCKSGRSDAPERVLELLDVMEREFKMGKRNLKPDSYTYSSVIDSFIKCNRLDAAQKAEEILRRMQDLHRFHGGDPPVTSVFNAVINAWACSESSHAVERAEAILKQMEDHHSVDSCIARPNRISYNTVIKAMRNGSADEAARAESLLKILEERSQNDNEFTPDSYSYTAVITAYGRSDDPNKAQKALAVLQRMIHAYKGGNKAAKPNVHSFNAALNACAFVTGDCSKKEEAFSISLQIVKLLQYHARADHTTYGTILRACSSLLPRDDERRNQVVEYIFRRACQEGQVGRLVVTQLKFAASHGQYLALIGRDPSIRVNLKELPIEWTCNVREQVIRKHSSLSSSP